MTPKTSAALSGTRFAPSEKLGSCEVFHDREGVVMHSDRHSAVGAQVLSSDETHFRVWAPGRRRVEIVLEGTPEVITLKLDGAGYCAGSGAVGPGALYRFRLDGGPKALPDPASRFQP